MGISNTFGSLPHWAVFEALKYAGAGDDFISIIKDVYWETSIKYRTTKGHSTFRVAATGVKQGDPLSGVLFILTINFILKKIQKEGSDRDPSSRGLFYRILAYSDDILLLARPAEDLQALLYLINLLARKIGLKFNTKKCSSLHYSSKPPAGCRPTIFNLAGSPISHLMDGDPTVFLGKPVGVYLPRDSATIDSIKQRGIKILTSKLTPWQRFDCLKSFFFPSLQFYM